VTGTRHEVGRISLKCTCAVAFRMSSSILINSACVATREALHSQVSEQSLK